LAKRSHNIRQFLQPVLTVKHNTNNTMEMLIGCLVQFI